MKVRLYDNFQVNLRKKNFDPFCRTFLTNRGKNEDEDDKIWKNEFDFGILHIKIRLWCNFHEFLKKKKLTHFLRHFWLIEAKMKVRVKKFWKMSSIFEFAISKLSYTEIFIKIWEKLFSRNFYMTRTYYNRGVRRVNILPKLNDFWKGVVIQLRSLTLLEN